MLRNAATCSSTSLCARQCMYLAGDAAGLPIAPSNVPTGCTSESGSGYAIGFNSTALTTEKMAMLAPMPSVNATTAVAVKSLLSRNSFHACLTSSATASIPFTPH
jgi:hypothetical protein